MTCLLVMIVVLSIIFLLAICTYKDDIKYKERMDAVIKKFPYKTKVIDTRSRIPGIVIDIEFDSSGPGCAEYPYIVVKNCEGSIKKYPFGDNLEVVE